jgi:hypothetical protein
MVIRRTGGAPIGSLAIVTFVRGDSVRAGRIDYKMVFEKSISNDRGIMERVLKEHSSITS